MKLLVVSESSLFSVLAITVLLGWICYFVMLCKHVATNHCIHNLEVLYKHVLFYISTYIHTCHWLHSYPVVAFRNLALKLLNNVAVSLLTLSSVLPWAFLVIHAPYELDVAMLSFINMSSYCWLPYHAMYWSVMSGTRSSTCLLIIVPAMFESNISFAMFTWVPSYLMIHFLLMDSKGLFYMNLVVSCHALSFYDKFL